MTQQHHPSPDLEPTNVRTRGPSPARLTLLRWRQTDDWHNGQARPVEDYLAAADGLGPEDVLVLIVGEMMLRRQLGERPELADYQRRFPDLADQFEVAAGLEGTWNTVGSAAPLPAAVLVRVPGYEVLGELGRGGMGVVYRARQASLNRVVALKMILAGGQASEEERRRFLVEAEAIARVRHAGIVQVYDYGTHEGLPYFSLEFCDGGSLAERLNGTPLPAGEAAKLVEQVARAVQAAHEKGIVHRDLKPANVLLSFSREPPASASAADALAGGSRLNECAPKVADFGLAKRVEGGGATRTGVVMGTPSYMPPEQARGSKDVGPLADVYALGAVLYECLTGRPPFKAATPLDTLLQVIRDEPAPVRRLQATVPLDLETICHKCLQKDSAKRYDSAGALADDLRRYLDGVPIVARPVGRVERLLSWCKREPAVAGLLAAVLLALTAGATAASVLAVKAVRAEEAAREKAEETVQEKEQAEKNLKLAKRAVDECLNIARENKLFEGPGMAEAKKLLLQTTLPFYKEFHTRSPDDPDLLQEEARQLSKVAYIEAFLGRRPAALAAYEQACEIFGKLTTDYPEVLSYQHELGVTHNELGYLLYQLGRHEEARKQYVRAREIHGQLAVARPDAPESRKELARSYHYLGLLQFDLDNYKEALEESYRALDIRSKLALDHPDVPVYRQDLAMTHNNLGQFQLQLGKGEDALREHLRARDVRSKLALAQPAIPGYRQDLAVTHNHLGRLLSLLSRGEEALREYNRACEIRSRLASAHPDIPAYQHDLAETLTGLGMVLADLGNREEAKQHLQRACDIFGNLASALPETPVYQVFLAQARSVLGGVLAGMGRHQEALEENQRAQEVIAKLAAAHPEYPRARALQNATNYNRACIYALAAASRARDAARPLPKREKRAEDDAREAVAQLRRLAAAGYFNIPGNVIGLDNDADLDGLRSRDDYRAFRQTLPAAKKPGP